MLLAEYATRARGLLASPAEPLRLSLGAISPDLLSLDPEMLLAKSTSFDVRVLAPLAEARRHTELLLRLLGGSLAVPVDVAPLEAVEADLAENMPLFRLVGAPDAEAVELALRVTPTSQGIGLQEVLLAATSSGNGRLTALGTKTSFLEALASNGTVRHTLPLHQKTRFPSRGLRFCKHPKKGVFIEEPYCNLNVAVGLQPSPPFALVAVHLDASELADPRLDSDRHREGIVKLLAV